MAIKATHDDNDIALAVAEIISDKAARLHSIMVLEKYRTKGIALALLSQLDTLLKKQDIQYIEASWPEAIQEAHAFDKLIKRSNWLPSQRTLLNVKLDVETALQAPWKNNLPAFDDNTQIINWSELTDHEKDEIYSFIKADGFPIHLTPFQLPEIMDSRLSKALRYNKNVIGWCVFHHINPDTVQCSALYIKNEFRNKYRCMKLLATCFSDAKNMDIRFIIYQVKYQDSLLIKFFDILTVNNAVVRKYHTLSSKNYYTDHQNKILS